MLREDLEAYGRDGLSLAPQIHRKFSTPIIFNFQNHDILQKAFMHASAWDLIPRVPSKIDPQSLKTLKNNKEGYFPGVLGIKSGLSRCGGVEIDGLLDISDDIGFIEIGPVTLDTQN